MRKQVMLQAGGHQLLKSKDGFIIKPTKLEEVEFYEKCLIRYPQLSRFVPKFFGSGLTSDIKNMFTTSEFATIEEKKYTHYIKLEDLSKTKCSILDVKLGSIHWKSDALLSVIENHRIRNRESVTNTHQFRLDGAIIDNKHYHKDDCRNMTIKQITEMFGKIDESALIEIENWIANLLDILKNISLNMYGPSLLIIFDGECVSIKLIDFTTYEECLGRRKDDIIESLESVKRHLKRK